MGRRRRKKSKRKRRPNSNERRMNGSSSNLHNRRSTILPIPMETNTRGFVVGTTNCWIDGTVVPYKSTFVISFSLFFSASLWILRLQCVRKKRTLVLGVCSWGNRIVVTVRLRAVVQIQKHNTNQPLPTSPSPLGIVLVLVLVLVCDPSIHPSIHPSVHLLTVQA